MTKQNEETYLGDGLYACYDGFQIILRAPREHGDHEVAMEPEVFQSFIDWVKTFDDGRFLK